MTGSALKLSAEATGEFIRQLISIKPRLKLMLPDDLARLKHRLRELHPEGGVKKAADYDLFYRVGIVLSGQQEPMTMSELSEALSVPFSSTTRMVEWLIESGYVKRLPDPEDGRIVRVSLTKAGQALYQTINDFLTRRLKQILSKFTPAERENLIALLRKGMDILKELE
ncbi:MAG: MarR family transcriptional regulator [Chloroflexi bacterium]|nr:MarR family transcriptional regulator [Chloroflexota bacterium]